MVTMLAASTQRPHHPHHQKATQPFTTHQLPFITTHQEVFHKIWQLEIFLC